MNATSFLGPRTRPARGTERAPENISIGYQRVALASVKMVMVIQYIDRARWKGSRTRQALSQGIEDGVKYTDARRSTRSELLGAD